MLDYTAIHLAARNRALTLVVVATAVTTLRATATGYERTDGGSFVDDGFWPGMEVQPYGFTHAAPGTITAVTAGALEILGGRRPDAEAPGRSLVVGLPSERAWENRKLTPNAGVPYVEEQFIDGPVQQVTHGPQGVLLAEPMYALLIHVPADTDLTPSVYADAVIRHFPPRLALPLANGDVVRVRSDVGPFRGQLQTVAGPYRGQSQTVPAGFVVKPITIPLRLRTTNSI